MKHKPRVPKRLSTKDKELAELRKHVLYLEHELDFFRLNKPKPFGYIAVDLETGFPDDEVRGIYRHKTDCQADINDNYYRSWADEDDPEILPKPFPVFLMQAAKDIIRKAKASTSLRPVPMDDFTYPADDMDSDHYDDGDIDDDRDDDGNSY